MHIALRILWTALFLLAAARAHAQAMTHGPLTLVVPFSAGGASDAVARAVAPALAERLRRSAVVENVTGASGSIGAARVAGGVADGSMVLVGSPTETILAPLTIKGLKYAAKDFRLLGIVYTAPLAIYTRRDMDVASVGQLGAQRQRAGAPPLNYGSPGQGSLYHIVTEKLRRSMDLEASHIPYRGGTPMLLDLMAGTIDFAMLPVDNVLGALVDRGKIKVIGVASAKRSARYPGVPTLDESTTARGLGHPSVWVGIFVSSRMADATVFSLHGALTEVLQRADTSQVLQALGGNVPEVMALDAAQAFYTSEAKSLGSMAREANVHVD
jgi:tripartite-type tricarboxylate transporter receptor subunit TctC